MKIKEEITAIMLRAKSFEEAFALLADACPDMDMEALEEAFMGVMENGELTGTESS